MQIGAQNKYPGCMVSFHRYMAEVHGRQSKLPFFQGATSLVRQNLGMGKGKSQVELYTLLILFCTIRIAHDVAISQQILAKKSV